ncbi:hypothetical protein I7I50_12475 [Histoplasma capsulatum G186AR]|uniref:Ankyrin repeat protein n=1 Tax=Ajellomyces capsulatus TaxID=5037 RepID=A0A8H7YD64_AJECA|nr:hypothetical protein I7I52_11218 [Histoplasma capsulatum]QSS70743.1 hypothetical protein I7I50_12475 [Histoplasma capsulatum G186AR]
MRSKPLIGLAVPPPLCLAAECMYEIRVELLLNNINRQLCILQTDPHLLFCTGKRPYLSIIRILLERDIEHAFHTSADGAAFSLNLAARRRSGEVAELLFQKTIYQESALADRSL